MNGSFSSRIHYEETKNRGQQEPWFKEKLNFLSYYYFNGWLWDFFQK